MGLVRGPRRDPVAQDAFFFPPSAVCWPSGRHHLVGIVGKDPPHHFAGIGLARDNRRAARLQLRHGRIAEIEPQLRLPGGVVRPVALEAVLAEDRPNVAREIGTVRPSRRGR